MPIDSQPGQNLSAELIQAQLKRIQASELFVHSRRYPAFLEFVVLKALEGKQDELKERTIGVEAFKRSPDYDLNADPVVRFIAGEVRKRLAQYYYEPEHQAELRIELRPGSYVPEFKYVALSAAEGDRGHALALETTGKTLTIEPQANKPTIDLPADIASPQTGARLRQRRILVGLAAAASLVLVLLASAASYFWVRTNTASEEFWRPVLSSPNAVLICIGSPEAFVSNERLDSDRASSAGGHPLSSNPVAMADAVVVAKIQQVLFNHSKQYSLQAHADVSFSDLQKGSVILISAFDNPWTMRLTDPLRFHFVRTGPSIYEIDDRLDPHRRWVLDTMTPFTRVGHDYGIVARFHDPTTDQMVVVAAGIGENGTLAAGNLIADKRFLEEDEVKGELPRRYQNLEAVVETETIDGKPGPPRILAVQTW
jgi:hypothetical protein